MIVPEDKTLMRNKKFVGVLGFGIICALVGLIVRGIYTNQTSSCIDESFCQGDSLCFQNGFAYCCAIYYNRPYTCGGFYNSCYQYGGFNEYSDCTGLIVTEWVMFSIATLALIALIVIAKRHNARRYREFAAEIMYAQNNNIIYSDRPQQPPVVPQNPIVVQQHPIVVQQNPQNLGNQAPVVINQSIADEHLRY